MRRSVLSSLFALPESRARPFLPLWRPSQK